MSRLRALAVSPVAALVLAFPLYRYHPSACRFDVRAQHTHLGFDKTEHRWHLAWSTPECHVDWMAVGEVTFARDASDIAGLSKGGSLVVTESVDGHTRALEMRPGNCMLTRRYVVDGKAYPLDAEAESWFADLLVQVDRASGALADVRFPRLMAAGGPTAVLTEVAMASDVSRTRYLAKLFATPTALDPAQWRRVAEVAAAMRSDYERANLLVTAAPQMDFTSGESRTAYFHAVSLLTSDYDKTRVLVSVADRGVPDDSVRMAYIAAARTIASDAQRARALTALVRQE
jgi:hypothetical protein